MHLLRTLFFATVAVVPLWMLVYLLYRTWQAPMAVDGGKWVKLGVGIMVLEFILVHSGAFFSAFSQKNQQPNAEQFTVKLLFGLLAFYLLFAVTFSVAFSSWMLFWTFCAVTVSRVLSLFSTPAAARQMIARSVVSAVLYLMCVFLSVFVMFPRAGLTREVLDRVYPDRGSGVWERDPQQALVAGMIYFGLLGLWELRQAFGNRQTKTRYAAETTAPAGKS